MLILDEATSQIDVESEQLIHSVLEEFTRNRTTILITHRPSTIALADRVVVMDKGRIVDVGTPGRTRRPLRSLSPAVPHRATVKRPLDRGRCLAEPRSHLVRLAGFHVGHLVNVFAAVVPVLRVAVELVPPKSSTSTSWMIIVSMFAWHSAPIASRANSASAGVKTAD